MTYTPLDLVESYLSRFVAYPSEHALVAHVLWIAHTHLIESFDTTPRLAFMSAEKESGKTRALEVTELFVRDSLMAFSATPAVLVRLLAERRRTLLYDEIDSDHAAASAWQAWHGPMAIRAARIRHCRHRRPRDAGAGLRGARPRRGAARADRSRRRRRQIEIRRA